MSFTVKQAIEESNHYGLGYLLPEDALEANVSEWVDELCHSLM